MRAFVTGGSGFIGSNLVELLVKNGHYVHVYDNLSTGKMENIYHLLESKLIDFTKGDILDKNLLIEKMKNVDVVFHLAASVGRQKSIDNPIEDSEINLIGTINVLESMRYNNVKKIIYSSSAAIYGELQSDIIDENHVLNPDCQYGVSKLAAEKMIIAYSGLYDISVHCLRYFNIYGKNQRYDYYGNVIPIFTHRILNNQPITIFGDGTQTRDFVNVSDVANANLLAAQSEQKINVVNIGSSSSITINELAQLIYLKFDKKPSIEYVNRRIGDVLHCKANIATAKKTLSFYPKIDIEQGLSEYIEWYKKNFE